MTVTRPVPCARVKSSYDHPFFLQPSCNFLLSARSGLALALDAFESILYSLLVTLLAPTLRLSQPPPPQSINCLLAVIDSFENCSVLYWFVRDSA